MLAVVLDQPGGERNNDYHKLQSTEGNLELVCHLEAIWRRLHSSVVSKPISAVLQAPRAVIFRRDTAHIDSMSSLKRIMRYNHYRDDEVRAASGG